MTGTKLCRNCEHYRRAVNIFEVVDDYCLRPIPCKDLIHGRKTEPLGKPCFSERRGFGEYYCGTDGRYWIAKFSIWQRIKLKINIKIPIIFGWLIFHRKEQWDYCTSPILVCHWRAAAWMKCDTRSSRLFCIGRKL